MMDEKNRDELMGIQMPPISVHKVPRIGEPAPPLQRASITFHGPIEAHTPLEKKVLARVRSVSTKDSGRETPSASRHAGTADTLVAQQKQLTSRIAHLCEEVELLRVVYTGLRGKAQAAALAALDSRADLELPLPPPNEASTMKLMTPEGMTELSLPALHEEDSRRGREAKQLHLAEQNARHLSAMAFKLTELRLNNQTIRVNFENLNFH